MLLVLVPKGMQSNLPRSQTILNLIKSIKKITNIYYNKYV
jgi:hypothetical protein